MTIESEDNDLEAVRDVISVYKGILIARIYAERALAQPDEVRIAAMTEEMYASARESKALHVVDIAGIRDARVKYVALIAAHRASQTE
jgi:hypothetical protein